MAVEIITYRGHSVVFGDYTPCKTIPEMITINEEVEQAVKSLPNGSLVLADFTGTHMNTEFVNSGKAMATRTFDNRVSKGAMLGIVGLKKVLLNGFNLVSKIKFKPFDTKEEALEYLVRD